MSEELEIKKALKDILDTLPKIKKYDEIEFTGEIFQLNQDKIMIDKLNYIIKILSHFYKVFFKAFPEIKEEIILKEEIDKEDPKYFI